MRTEPERLIGVGLYTPAEAGRLLDISAGRIASWLRGHHIDDREYDRLWTPQIDLEDGRICLDFRDLMEVRIADKFISYGVSPQRVRAAIKLARQIIGEDRALSTDRFRTDGRSIFSTSLRWTSAARNASACSISSAINTPSGRSSNPTEDH